MVANEVLLERTGLRVGDRVVVTFWGEDELGLFGPDGTVLHGPQVEVEIVGVGRGLTDLTAVEEDFAKAEASGLHFSEALAARTDDAAGFSGVLVEAVDDDAAAATAAIEEAFGDRPMNSAPALGADETDPIREAIRYEAQAVIALGLIMALVVATFIGQAVVRQSRREWSDGPILRAIGVTGREGGAAALLRGAAIGVPAAVVAVVTAVALSPFGPGRCRARRRGRPRGGGRRHGAARRRARGDRRRDRRGVDPARSGVARSCRPPRWRSARGRGGHRRCRPWPPRASSSPGGARGRRSRWAPR